MNARPVVTIVTPCLNPGPRLRRCLDSVAAQDYPELEHIVVDGGSTDGTQDILADRVATWISEPDEGQADAIRKGFRLGSGTILGWLNADDTLEPGAVGSVVDAFVPGVGVIYGYCKMTGNQGGEEIFRPPAVLDHGSFIEGNPIAQPAALFTRDALEQAGGLDPTFDLAMDFDLWFRMVEAGVVFVHVPRILATFELHRGSKTGSISWSRFLEEEARAFLKSGRDRLAALRLGWAAVILAERMGRVRQDRLRDVIEELAGRFPVSDPRAFRKSMTASAYSRAARFELEHGRPQGIRHLMRPEPWRDELSRRRLLRNVRNALTGTRGD